MNRWNTADLIATDKRYVWHPFTRMDKWCALDHEPLVLVEGRGALLWDSEGREYIDGNSSIWTNIHGHNHPAINAAIWNQLELVAHTSFLGFTNPVAIELAHEIVGLFPQNTLTRVFYSDDGSTGVEVALRIADQYWRLRGQEKHQFVAFESGYHGDTAGAASLGAAAMFRNSPLRWKFPVRRVASLAELENISLAQAEKIAAVVIEPLVQGAAGIKLWPKGTLQGLRNWCNQFETLLIADEVLTGFGRTGTMFASEQENVLPDVMVLAKGLTGGYVPLAVTLTTEEIFLAFCRAEDSATLFYGHSYTGNAVACAAARASLNIFKTDNVLEALNPKIKQLVSGLESLRRFSRVKEIRWCGFMAGIAMKDQELAARVCLAARKFGLLTRPLREVVVLMPPLCITTGQLKQALDAIASAITDVSPNSV